MLCLWSVTRFLLNIPVDSNFSMCAEFFLHSLQKDSLLLSVQGLVFSPLGTLALSCITLTGLLLRQELAECPPGLPTASPLFPSPPAPTGAFTVLYELALSHPPP